MPLGLINLLIKTIIPTSKNLRPPVFYDISHNILALQGNYTDAAAVLMELLAGSQTEIAPQQQFHILILLAGLHFSAGEYEEAGTNYRSAARIDPRLAGDYRYLAGGAATDGEARASSAADTFSPSWFVDEESDGE